MFSVLSSFSELPTKTKRRVVSFYEARRSDERFSQEGSLARALSFLPSASLFVSRRIEVYSIRWELVSRFWMFKDLKDIRRESAEIRSRLLCFL